MVGDHQPDHAVQARAGRDLATGRVADSPAAAADPQPRRAVAAVGGACIADAVPIAGTERAPASVAVTGGDPAAGRDATAGRNTATDHAARGASPTAEPIGRIGARRRIDRGRRARSGR